MEVVTTIKQTRALVASARARGESVGFVPTMGALHVGHRSLIQASRQKCDLTVVSIFVNPTQFGPAEDFDSYPRVEEKDRTTCDQEGVDLLFMPPVKEVYPQPCLSTLRVRDLTSGLCGRFRSGHFDGVATVVLKLFNMVQPDQAFFGEKDYQQLRVIQQMVADLMVPVEIVACPTYREADGLALSSRNQYLTAGERVQAAVLHRAMGRAVDSVHGGSVRAEELLADMRQEITAAGPCIIEYIDIVDTQTLQDLDEVDRPARICLAVRIGACRLIDNIAVDRA